jgi:hypothetical protein
MNQYGYPNPVVSPHLGDAIVAPPTFGPEIASLGNLIDSLTQRRMQIEVQRRQDEQLALQQKREEAKETYYRGKQELAEKKQDSDRQYQIAQGNAAAMKTLTGSLRPGQAPQPVLMRGPDGSPTWVTPKYVPRRSQAQPAATVPQAMPETQQQQGGIPTMMGKPLMAPPTLHAALDARGEAEAPQQDTVLLDEPEGDTAQAVIEGHGDPRTVQLPRRAFPEGATEGERFNQEDVNLMGGFGNPFARDVLLDEPEGDTARSTIETGAGQKDTEIPMSSFPHGAREGDRFPAEDVHEQPSQGGIPTMMGKPLMAPPLVSGPAGPAQASAPEAEDMGGYWLVTMPDGREMRISEDDTMSARRDLVKVKISEITAAMESPDAQANPQLALMLARERAMLVGGLDPSDRRAMQQAMATGERQDKQIASNERIAQGRNETSVKVSSMRKKRGGSAASAAASSDPTSSDNNPWASLSYKERNPTEQRLLREVRDWSTQQGWSKLMASNPGRLEWAAKNISLDGPNSGAAHAEAMMNLFGIARGGVPVENETKEFRKGTTNINNHLANIGKNIGIPELASLFESGEGLTPDQMRTFERGWSGMPPRERAAISEAIRSTTDSLVSYGRRKVMDLKQQFDSEPLAYRYKMTSLLNSLGSHVGMEPRQWWSDVPLAGKGKSVDAGGAPKAATGGGLADKLQQLQQLLGGAK